MCSSSGLLPPLPLPPLPLCLSTSASLPPLPHCLIITYWLPQGFYESKGVTFLTRKRIVALEPGPDGKTVAR